MIDLTKIKYSVLVMDENGKQYNIKDFVQNLGWEDNENEISVRSSFTAVNDETASGYLSSIIKPGCLISICASDGTTDGEVARGYVERWNPEERNGGNVLKCTMYDDLYKMQKSQDNRYFPSSTGTRSAITSIFDDWGIPLDYRGPNVSHGKKVYNNKYLPDIILDLLDDAAKQGGDRCIIRASEGTASVIPRGSNADIYVFAADNSKVVSRTVSTENLITRVKVVGQSDDDGKHSVDAMMDGLIQYGIRQRIYTRGSDETLDDAKASAQEILNNEGRISDEMTVESPDVPYIRKGDLVYIMTGTASGYYYVKGIQHNAENCSMTMTVESEKA